MEAIATVLALVRIFSMGAVLYGASKKGYDEAELGLIEKVFEAGGLLCDAYSKNGPPIPSRVRAVHTALITQAFGEACDEHWAGNKDLAPGLVKPSRLRRLFESTKRNERREDIQSRLQRALDNLAQNDDLQKPHARLDPRHSLSGDPIASPMYRALWEAFTNSLLASDDQPPLIDLGQREDARLEFEETVRTAYDEALTSSLGEPLAKYLMEPDKEKPRLLRRLLAQRMATWGERHVFGDIETPGIPYIPLAEIYVEPDGVLEDDERRAPVRILIKELLQSHKIVILRGDFGHGKSLTARMLAWEWAQAYRRDTQTPSSELIFPLFIKCGVDFLSHHPSMGDTIRNALRNQAQSLGISLLMDDMAFNKPDAAMRVVYLIDGLDEVALTPNELQKFFDELRGHTSDRHRAILFSRRGALPEDDKFKDIPLIDLEGLRTREEDEEPGAQVAEWLKRWNGLSAKAPITAAQLHAAGLLDIAETPIVLFMAALTWDPERSAQGEVNRAAVYEKFFLQIARGKCEQDPDEHGPIQQASQRLRAELVKQGIMPRESLKSKNSLPEAMLWLMSRVAWEWQKFEQRKQHLTMHEVIGILRNELQIRDESRSEELIRIGMLLAMQANLQGGNDKILFGHKSFREFLVARYWAHQLRRIIGARKDRDKVELTEALLGAPLLGYGDKSFDFLMMILNGEGWDKSDRQKIVEWAEERFNDEAPNFEVKKEAWIEDRNPYLRHAALAIGSSLKDSPGIRAENANTLRSLLAWFWLREESCRIIAPGLIARGSCLGGAILTGANLIGANLIEANLDRANLFGVDLVGANLDRANLFMADLTIADLRIANLDRANLRKANLEGANLFGARYSAQSTQWPIRFDPIAKGALNIDPKPEK